METKPNWFKEHEESDTKRFDKLEEKMPSKDLIVEQFGRTHEKLQDLKKTTDENLAQAKKTNGRVNGHDAYIKGIVMCGTLFVVIVLPLAVYAYNVSQQNLKNQILVQVNNQLKSVTK